MDKVGRMRVSPRCGWPLHARKALHSVERGALRLALELDAEEPLRGIIPPAQSLLSELPSMPAGRSSATSAKRVSPPEALSKPTMC